MADAVVIPKEHPILDISKHLRPVSLTLSLSKVAEEFDVTLHLAPAVIEAIESVQSNPLFFQDTSLGTMVHQWLGATDETGAAVRVVFFDYRKAFGSIDHNILVQKILGLAFPDGGWCSWSWTFL